jgi:hypothetical protein
LKQQRTVYQLLQILELEKSVLKHAQLSEHPQPSILTQCLSAPDPVALAIEAI